MTTEKTQRKDWTKIEIETIKRYLPKILLFFVIILPLIYIGYVAWINMNIPNANSGVTVDATTYGVHNKTINQTINGTVSDSDIDTSSVTDFLKYIISWFPVMFGLFLILQVFSWINKD
jgi:hypothetical protein